MIRSEKSSDNQRTATTIVSVMTDTVTTQHVQSLCRLHDQLGCRVTLCAKEVDRRKDWTRKTTTSLVRDYDLVAIEDLRVKNMVRSAKGTVEEPGKNVAQKAGLNRSIQSQAWSVQKAP